MNKQPQIGDKVRVTTRKHPEMPEEDRHTVGIFMGIENGYLTIASLDAEIYENAQSLLPASEVTVFPLNIVEAIL